jgi:adenosylcobinamide-phosphate synthase
MAPSPALHVAAVLVAAFALDATAGEYPARLHPVVWMGRVIGALERRAPAPVRPRAQLRWGAGMALAVPALFAAGAWAALAALRPWPAASLVAEAMLLKSTFAVRALGRAAEDVRRSLASRDLPSARAALRSLCSRDASALDAPRVAAAAVESVAENLSDSFVAPVLFFAVLGVPGAVLYRAVNTLDARIGYRGRYEWLGKCSARLDDALNLVPARLTAALLLAAGALAGRDPVRGARVLRRDGGKTESPNAGRPMAAMAGLLGVELEKVDHYRLGDPLEPVGAATIASAWRMARLAAILALGLAGAFGWGAHVLA